EPGSGDSANSTPAHPAADDRPGRHRVGNDKVTGVRSGNAVTLGQSYHLADQLLLLPVDADLVEQVTDLPPRPQLLDTVPLLARLRREGEVVNELLALLADSAAQLDGGGALAVVAAHDHQLPAVEQVGQPHRVDLAQADARRRAQLQVGQHRVADLAIKRA